MNKSYSVHAPLNTLTVWVDNSIFYNLTEGQGSFTKAKLFGITCLTGRVPTFEIITDEGYVFSDVPPHLLFWKAPAGNEVRLCLTDLIYNNCLSEDFVISQFPELQERTANVLFKSTEKYEKAEYWFSLDFYKNNNWYHCLKLENGQFAFIPSHKIVFSKGDNFRQDHKFPNYQKLRHEFKV